MIKIISTHWEAVEIKSGNFPIVKSEYKGFIKDTREHIYKLQVAANRDHLKTAGARDYQTGQTKNQSTPSRAIRERIDENYNHIQSTDYLLLKDTSSNCH